MRTLGWLNRLFRSFLLSVSLDDLVRPLELELAYRNISKERRESDDYKGYTGIDNDLKVFKSVFKDLGRILYNVSVTRFCNVCHKRDSILGIVEHIVFL